MTIADEIIRIKEAKTFLKSSIEAKGVSVPTTTKIDGYSALVDQISTGITPSGTTNITENGIYDVTNFASANVNVSGGGSSQEDELIERTISGLYTNNRVSKIGSYAFCYCASLTNISFPQCTTIDTYTFFYCSSLTTVSFPQCTTIGSYAFASCFSLRTASFPQCATIGSYAFNKCFSLRTASFPQCTTIGSSAFASCFNLLSLYLLGNSIPSLTNITAFKSTPISDYTTSTGGVHGSIIVQPSMIEAFKTATNWSTYSSRFSAWNGVD